MSLSFAFEGQYQKKSFYAGKVSKLRVDAHSAYAGVVRGERNQPSVRVLYGLVEQGYLAAVDEEGLLVGDTGRSEVNMDVWRRRRGRGRSGRREFRSSQAVERRI